MDSIPSLRRKLAEANARIAELEARVPATVVQEVVRYVDKPVEVERTRYEYIDRVQTEYVTDPKLEATIRELQEALRECTSQSDL
jgi:hypothetical protein